MTEINYSKGSTRALKLQKLVLVIQEGIKELEKLEGMDVDYRIKHRKKMLDYMKKESDELEHSIDSYINADFTGC